MPPRAIGPGSAEAYALARWRRSLRCLAADLVALPPGQADAALVASARLLLAMDVPQDERAHYLAARAFADALRAAWDRALRPAETRARRAYRAKRMAGRGAAAPALVGMPDPDAGLALDLEAEAMHLYRLGPRAVAEFCSAIAREHDLAMPIRAMLRTWRSLAPATVTAALAASSASGRQFPPRLSLLPPAQDGCS